MTFVHGREEQITVAAKDISQWVTNSQMTRAADVHQMTGKGATDHANKGGIKKGEFTMEGNYDSSNTLGPRAVLKNMEGTVMAIIRKPEGTGTGKPQEAFSAVLEEYVETAPIADYIKWSAKFTRDGAVTDTTQP